MGLVALVAGVIVGWVISKRGPAGGDGEARELLEAARAEAETTKRDAELEAKDLLFKMKSEAEREAKERLEALKSERKSLVERKQGIESEQRKLESRAKDLEKKAGELEKREKAAEANSARSREMVQKAERRIEELAKLTPEQAKEMLIEQVKADAQAAAAAEVKRIEDETERTARERATNIIAMAIQRHASEYVGERTVAVVQLPSDDLKGRIIGREGRNIRALEAATGVDLIVDDTPEAVILSCFNPVRREVARLTLTRLLTDGRIHPSRIEEVVKRATDEVEAICKEAGEQAVFDLGLHRVHPELVRLLGQLKFRSSYAQNLLAHSVEVAYIAGIMASELGLGVKQARRAGLLHDIGKAIDHEVEGTHATIGANIAKKYGESPKVQHAIAAHHGDVEPQSVLAHIVDAANQLSSRRPGARRQKLHSFVQRLDDIEKLCKNYAGVERAYAIQAGREVRVIVQKDDVSDEMAVLMSKDLARQIEDQMTYPGQIKVCVIRETRASDLAR
ncbi:MAG: ribonuclease Y [Myxococcales bacterium]|nr:ribonuclease Y [Myxococcales bacterium]